MIIKLKRLFNSYRNSYLPDEAELIYELDTNRLFIGDGVNYGGFSPLLTYNMLIIENDITLNDLKYNFIISNAYNNEINIELPDANNYIGTQLIIKHKTISNSPYVTKLIPFSSQTFDDSNQILLSNDNECITLISEGDKWSIINWYNKR